MAETSFTLRKTTVGFGSYVQGAGVDSALRSDGYIAIATAGEAEVSTFSANIVTENSVQLRWDLSFEFATSASSPNPIGLRIVASPLGEPITAQDGVVVVQTSNNTVNVYNDIVRVSPGRWVYYSLFIQWSDFATPEPTTWYERAGSLYIQIPINYESINNLWARIPEYYRVLDAEQPTAPLYNFLELFGWELDRTRTLIETVALSNDPQLAVTPALKELAKQTGIEFDPATLGTSRTRTLMQNIGYLRRRKGNVESISSYLSSITGCQVTYQFSDPTHTFKVHSQRINFITDPKFTQALTPGATGTTPYKTSLYTSSTYGVHTYAPTTSAAASVTALGSSLVISVPNTGTGNTIVTVYSKDQFPRHIPAYYYSSFEASYAGGASFATFDFETSLVWETVLSPGNAPSYDLTETPQILPVDPATPQRTRVQIDPFGSADDVYTVYPYLVFVIPPGGSVTITKWMVEPNSIGDYFDGSTREGGLIPQTTGFGTGVSDYRWADTTNASFSYYLLDYQKVATLSEDIIKNYLASVLIKDNVVIEWNYYPGK